MSLSTVSYDTAFLYEKGGRQINEDSLALMDVLTGSSHMLLAVVADGIGGLKNGDYASSYTVRRLKVCFENTSLSERSSDINYLARCFKKELYKCHMHLIKTSKACVDGCGTTLTLLCLIGKRGITVNVGDSHLYHIHRRSIKLIGRDHTDRFGRLTRCIGRGTYHRIRIHRIRVGKDDTFVLCSDGFYRLGEQSIRELALSREKKIDEPLLSDCLDRAFKHITSAGERDNISAITVHVGSGRDVDPGKE